MIKKTVKELERGDEWIIPGWAFPVRITQITLAPKGMIQVHYNYMQSNRTRRLRPDQVINVLA